VVAVAQQAQRTSPAVAIATATPVASPSPSDAIAVNINGRAAAADPAPILVKGSVFVPLRGVLESLGAKVTYDTSAGRIDIARDSERYSLRVGQSYAVSGAKVVTLANAPIQVNGRAFVPLRALAELFGFQVQWLAASRTVAINDLQSPTAVVAATSDHRAALASAGRFGVGINFHDVNSNEVVPLLDAAKKAGASLVKFRFDWSTLEPQKGGAFQWALYDRVVREARARGLTPVGVLGNSPRWATRLPQSTSALEWRNSAPVASALPNWENYVRRVVGRYKNDVQAWQVWENPATYNFRAGEAKDYRIVVRRAAEIARSVDPHAIVLAAEPGGVNLGFVDELSRNGLLPHVDGVALYPVSQWQPGVVAQPEEALLPVATLQKEAFSRNEEYWIGGLSRLSLDGSDLQSAKAEGLFRTKDHDLRRRLAQTFTPAAQADYLVRASTLALASGTEKIFWANLRDEPQYDLVDPVNSLYGGGLLRADSTARPSYGAFANLTRQLEGKKYLGALYAGPRVVVLIFEDAKSGEGSAVAWAIPGQGEQKLVLNPSADPGVPGSIFVPTRADARLIDSTGDEVGGAAGAFPLTSSPLWITQVSFKALQQLHEDLAGRSTPAPLIMAAADRPSYPNGLRAVFAPGTGGAEEGLNWRRYLGFRGAAFEFENFSDGQTGLKTTYSRDIYNPAAGNPYIYLDVDNSYLFFAHGVPVRVTIEVKRPAALEGVFAPQAGFNLQYDSPSGFKSTPWKVVEGGEGWTTYTIDIPDASFANRDGFDLLINTWGSRQDLVFRSISLRRNETRDARAGDSAATQ
jgi:hypothetical protein